MEITPSVMTAAVRAALIEAFGNDAIDDVRCDARSCVVELAGELTPTPRLAIHVDRDRWRVTRVEAVDPPPRRVYELPDVLLTLGAPL